MPGARLRARGCERAEISQPGWWEVSSRDHIGGAISVVREFRPREVWEGIPVPRFEPLRAVRAEALGLGLRWANVRTGDRVEIDGVELIVRHPDAADWERQRVRNDDSIVIELPSSMIEASALGKLGIWGTISQ